MKKFAVLVALVATFVLAPAAANAAIPSALGISCTEQGPGPNAGQRWCGTGAFEQLPANDRSTVPSFDGVPIDVNVAFPASGGDGPYPLVMMFHGYGGGKINFPGMQRWLNKGYAVFSMTNRGFHESCGTPTSKLANPICNTEGFVRLNDTRYEVRDAQLFAGMLVDEGVVEPTKIAASGGSYGGGMSMALAALKNRTMLPDDSLVPWQSPSGTPMSLAVAIPNIPWTDLAYSLVPNGSNLDYIKDASYFGRFGVMKQSYVNGLYLSGLAAPGYYTAPGLQPSADLTGWKAYLDLGEPYDGSAQGQAILDEIRIHHSSYYIDDSVAPAPLLISSGFTDDLFPANEATRFYNRTRANHPNSPIGLFFGSFGHPRGQNGAEVVSALTAKEDAWVDHYLTGAGAAPASDVTAFSQVCPNADPDGGPYTSTDWASASPGEIRLIDEGASQTVSPTGGDRAVGTAFNPVTGSACATPAGAKEAGTANYELPPAPAGGYDLLGSPTLVAKITLPGDNSQLAARIVDVSPDGATKTLINRGIWRPGKSGFQVFQLTPNAWQVKEGHVLRLELLPFDGGSADPAGGTLSNFSRPSNGQAEATIEDVDLRIPVRDAPGSAGGLVKAPAAKVLPDRPGVELAKGYESAGSETLPEYTADQVCPEGTTGTPPDCASPPPEEVVGPLKMVARPTVKGKKMRVNLLCSAKYDSCAKATVKVKAKGKVRGFKKPMLAKRKNITVKPSNTKRLYMNLTGKARKIFKDKRFRKNGKKKVRKGAKKVRANILINGKSYGVRSVLKIGKVR